MNEEYCFKIILANNSDKLEEIAEKLYSVGANDASVGEYRKNIEIVFDKEATSFSHAVMIALNQVESAGYKAKSLIVIDEKKNKPVIQKNQYNLNLNELKDIKNKYPGFYNAFELLVDVVNYYADPETYFAISLIGDSPCGDFIDDFSETDHLGFKPGKLAREVLEKIFLK